MKRSIWLLLICVLGLPAFAQTTKPLPAGIAGWAGQDSDKLLKDPVIKSRLTKLLGKTNYADFMTSFETQTPIEKNGSTLFASGCLIHACTHLESAIAIDTKANTIHAAIFNDEKKTRYFNERRSKTPASIDAWANHLNDLKSK
jgi:hypothetical protein